MFQTFSVLLSKLKISISTGSRSYYMYFFLPFNILFYFLSYLQYMFLEIIYSEQKLLVEHRTEFKITIYCVVGYLNIIWNIRLRIRILNIPTTFMLEISDNWTTLPYQGPRILCKSAQFCRTVENENRSNFSQV